MINLEIIKNRKPYLKYRAYLPKIFALSSFPSLFTPHCLHPKKKSPHKKKDTRHKKKAQDHHNKNIHTLNIFNTHTQQKWDLTNA